MSEWFIKLLVIPIFIFLSAFKSFGFDIRKLQSSVYFYERPYYKKLKANHAKGILRKGDEINVISLKHYRYKIYAIEVKVISGDFRGDTGWIYEVESNIDSVVLKRKKRVIISKHNIKLENGKYFSVSESGKKREVNFKKGEYPIDFDNYDPKADYIPIKVQYSSGKIGVERIKKSLIAIEAKYQVEGYLQGHHQQHTNSSNDGFIGNVCKSKPTPIVNYCDVLDYDSSDMTVEEVGKCLESIQDRVLKGITNWDSNLKTTVVNNRKLALTRLYTELNPKEREFAAYYFTAIGEARTLYPPITDLVAVMKVIKNRKNLINRSGGRRDRPDRQVSALDIALHSAQFSPYNRNDRQKLRFMAKRGRVADIGIKAFIEFKKGKSLLPGRDDSRIYNFAANYAPRKKWMNPRYRVIPIVNGQTVRTKGTYHEFFENQGYAYVENSFKKAARREGKL